MNNISRNTQAFSLFSKERKKQKITLTLMVLSYAPFLLFATLPSLDVDSVLSYIARQSGYMAAVLLLWQFILGTRSLTKMWLMDQIWALEVHKKIGMFAIFVVALHPLLIGAEYGWSFTPGFANDYDQHVTFGMIAFLLFLVIWVSSAILRSKIGYRPWKYIHYLSYPLMMAVVIHPPDIGTFFLGSSLIQAAWSALSIMFFLIVLIRIGSLFTFGQRSYTVKEVAEVAEDVFRYTLVPNNKMITPKPGQFVYLRRGVFSEEHPFSVANYDQDGTLQIVAKRFGKYTTKLAKTKVGSKVYLDGPYGIFTKELNIDPGQPTTFIAGGIGITPFLQHIYSDNTDNLHLFSANRGVKNILYRDQLKKILGDRYIDVLSDAKKDTTTIKHGYVNADMLMTTLGDAFSKQHFYICGPPIMMESMKKQLAKAGIPASQIHTEEFGY